MGRGAYLSRLVRHTHGDVVTDLDYAAEEMIISGLRESFPEWIRVDRAALAD